MNLEGYFSEELSEQDKINKSILNLSRKSHREMFRELVEKQLDIVPIESAIIEILNGE